MDEAKKASNQVVHEDIEPGVINEEMINSAILNEGYKGEAGRLARMERINFETVTVVRLEFHKILKIDHLWILPSLEILSLAYNKIDRIENLENLKNLKELNLSFNFIEKIENLENLVNLEVLSLFGNKIKKLENIDNLENLLIFSIGDNQIDTYDGIERLRFVKSLRSFNMEGNPIAQDKDKPMRQYIAAFLPTLKYYNYAFITPEERSKALAKYRFELRELEDKEKTEIIERKRVAKEKQDLVRLSACFVEYLNEHQLFDSLFMDDPEGDALMSIEGEVVGLKNDYREETYRITQRIYRIGLEQHERRSKEIKLFQAAIKVGREQAQKLGIKLIDQFLEEKRKTFKKIKDLVIVIPYLRDPVGVKQEGQPDRRAEIQKELDQMKDEFIEKLEDLRKTLMQIELQLFERVEEANQNFAHVIQDLTNEFIELIQAQFVLLRDGEINFNDVLAETVQRYLTLRAATMTDESEIPEPLREFLQDKEYVSSLAVGMRDLHMQRIDAREDRLITRSRGWAKDLCDKFQNDETRRNREKVQEITYFVRSQLEQLQVILRPPRIPVDDDDL